MKNYITLILILTLFTTQAQVSEIGANYNIGSIVGEAGLLIKPEISPVNLGIVYKRNLNPRVARRYALNFLQTQHSKILEVSGGLDFNFSEYNTFRIRNKKQTFYVILEANAFYYKPIDEGGKLSFGIPIGLGYKKIFRKYLGFYIEGKARLTFNDGLDGINTNESTFDSYYFTSFGIFYTFGRRNEKERIKF